MFTYQRLIMSFFCDFGKESENVRYVFLVFRSPNDILEIWEHLEHRHRFELV